MMGLQRTAAVRWLGGVSALWIILWGLSGCQRSPAPPSPTAQAEAENARLREALERTGKTMEELIAQVERQQVREAEKTGDPPVVRDLAVARAALTEAQKAVAAKDAETAATAIALLRRVLQSLAAELPAALIVQRVDRAIYQIKATLAVAAKQFGEAQMELVAAYEAAIHERPAELVPAVASELDGALKALKKGEAETTLKTLHSIVAKCLEQPAIGVLAQAQTEARLAEEALRRSAWGVVSAELAQLEGLLSQLVAAPPPTKGEAPTGGAATAPPAPSGAGREGAPNAEKAPSMPTPAAEGGQAPPAAPGATSGSVGPAAPSGSGMTPPAPAMPATPAPAGGHTVPGGAGR